jgi:hypothetical protein
VHGYFHGFWLELRVMISFTILSTSVKGQYRVSPHPPGRVSRWPETIDYSTMPSLIISTSCFQKRGNKVCPLFEWINQSRSNLSRSKGTRPLRAASLVGDADDVNDQLDQSVLEVLNQRQELEARHDEAQT